MQTFIMILHLLVVFGLVCVVLIQRSEGGILGSDGSGSRCLSPRSAADALTRVTVILASIFFITSLTLGVLPRYTSTPGDVLSRIPASSTKVPGILDALSSPKSSGVADKEEKPASSLQNSTNVPANL